MKRCTQCGHSNPASAKFCNNCGAKLEGRPIDPDSPTSPLPQQEDPDKTPRLAERRQLTILFCDLVDSTPLSEQLDPEEYRQVILDYHQVAENVIVNLGGYVGNYLGDGLLAYFGYPEGLEDAPMAGVRAGLGILQAVSVANKSWDNIIKIRIGIHTGLAVVDEHLALGETVNVAARLEGLAPPNGLVVSPNTLKLIQGWFEYKSLGTHQLKGISDPIEVFQVLKESGATTPLEVAKGKGLSPLVGRQAELDQLEKLWSFARAGNGTTALLHGEAGIGKSRLMDSFKEHATPHSEAQVIETRCSAYHQNSTFYPIVNLFEKELLQFQTEDTTEDKLTKLETFVEASGLDLPVALPLLAEFLSISSEKYPVPAMSPFAKRAKLLESITQGLLARAGSQPLLLMVEDLHWADASTIEWLTLLLDQLAENPMLMICTSRPGASFDWNQQNQVTHINLERLTGDSIENICLHQTGGKPLPPEILEQITEKTEGVPLFVEELTKMILESDLIVEKDNGYETVGKVSDLAIPSTLQDSLLSRLDRLSNIREVAHVGSVLGREFTFEMLASVLPKDHQVLEQSLTRLVDAELITSKHADKKTIYQFKHALIRDTAYESMLKSRRRQLHQRTAEVLQEKFKEISSSQPELLAYHLTEAASYQQSIPLWLLAGQLASKQNATSEAIAHLEKGIALLPHISNEEERKQLELDLRLTLGGTYVVSHGFPHPLVKQTFDQARELAQGMEVNPKLALILFNILSYYFNTEDYQSLRELVDQMKLLSNHSEHGYWFELFSVHLDGGASLIKGEFQRAREMHEYEEGIFDASLPFPWELAPSGHLEVCIKAWQMVYLQILGYHNQARALADKHLDFTKVHKDSMTLYHIYTFPSLHHLLAREWQLAEEAIEIYLPIVRKFGDPVFTLTAEVYYYVAKSFLGDQEAFDTAVNLMNVCFQVGFKAFAVSLSPFIAEQYYLRGDFESALSWIEKFLTHVNQTGSHTQTAELYRIKGLTLQASGRPQAEALEMLEKASDLSKKQSAKTFELRAAVDQARLLQAQGKSKEAYQLVSEIYHWFTEGFDSKDLLAAKSLLDQLESEVLT